VLAQPGSVRPSIGNEGEIVMDARVVEVVAKDD
jgi:hypothetical protein